MKGLSTLIRLHKRKLDELRRQLGNLEKQKDQLLKAIEVLQKELDSEIALAANAPEMASFFGSFSERIKNRQEKIRGEIKVIDAQMAELGEKIFEEFTELKKFEIALENAKLRAAENAKRKETILLDEIATQQYVRKSENSQ